MQATSFVSAGKKHRRLDRKRHNPANSQMILYSPGGRSQT